MSLRSVSIRQRVSAAELAGQLCDRCSQEVRKTLRAMLGERKSDLKRAAASTLLALGVVDDDVTNVFIADLTKDDADAREQAYQNLVRIAGPECGLMTRHKRS